MRLEFRKKGDLNLFFVWFGFCFSFIYCKHCTVLHFMADSVEKNEINKQYVGVLNLCFL